MAETKAQIKGVAMFYMRDGGRYRVVRFEDVLLREAEIRDGCLRLKVDFGDCVAKDGLKFVPVQLQMRFSLHHTQDIGQLYKGG